MYLKPLCWSSRWSVIQGLDIWKSFGSTHVLKGVHITLHSGVNCIRGPNGAGKSTLLKILSFLERPDRGALVFFGERVDSGSWRKAERLRGKVVYLPQTAELFSVPVKSLLSICRNKEAAARWAKYFGVADALNRNAASLSPGMRRRVQLALAFSCTRNALLLDEPESYLDEEGRGLLADAIRETSADVVIGYVSHEDPLVPCDVTYLMSGGVVVKA